MIFEIFYENHPYHRNFVKHFDVNDQDRNIYQMMNIYHLDYPIYFDSVVILMCSWSKAIYTFTASANPSLQFIEDLTNNKKWEIYRKAWEISQYWWIYGFYCIQCSSTCHVTYNVAEIIKILFWSKIELILKM